MITITTPKSLLPSWQTPADDAPPAAAPAVETQSELPGEGAAAEQHDGQPPFDIADDLTNETATEPSTKDVEYSAADHPVAMPDGDGLAGQIGAAVAGIVGIPELLELEHKLLDPIYRVEREINELIERERELDDQLREVREELESSRDAKSELLNALPARVLAIRDGLPLDDQPVVKIDRDDEPTAPVAAPPAQDDNAWRAILTETITKGVPGLGTKKAETLAAQFPTLGDLEDARARAAAGHKHFADELPKGIGKQSADELANRIMTAQTAGDTRPASEVVEPRKTATAAKPEAASDPAATPAPVAEPDAVAAPAPVAESAPVEQPASEKPASEKPAKQPAEPKADGSAIQPRMKHEMWCRATVASLREDATEEALKENVGECWVDGFDAHAEGARPTDCPPELQQAYQIDWLKGWLHRELFGGEAVDEQPGAAVNEPSEYGDDDAVEPDAEEAASEIDGHTPESFLTHLEAAADAPPAFDPAALAEKCKATGDTDPKKSKAAWGFGYSAAIDDQTLDALPGDQDEDWQADWVRGWVAGSAINFGI